MGDTHNPYLPVDRQDVDKVPLEPEDDNNEDSDYIPGLDDGEEPEKLIE